MGMPVAAGKTGVVSDPNVVPLIDVLLVLIIIFMVITPQVAAGLAAFIPEPAPPSSTQQSPDPHTIVVRVMQGGKLMINQERTSWDTLGARLSFIFKQRASRVAFVRGAEEVPFADVARAINIMRVAGVDHVGLLTSADVSGEVDPK